MKDPASQAQTGSGTELQVSENKAEKKKKNTKNASGLKLEGREKAPELKTGGNDRGYVELYNQAVMPKSVC